jgi:outer membrane protein assembly factor BamB
MMNQMPFVRAIASLVFSLASSAVFAADWPQFLGPDRNGISAETGLIDAFPKDGPKAVWRANGGVGMSGVAISGGKVLTLVQKDGKQWCLALDAASGKTIWETLLAPEYENQMGNGPRATPTIAGDKVFVFTGEGILAALNFADGKKLWSHDAVKDHGGEPADYGMTCSPLVVGKRVVVTAGAPKAAVVAYDALSGKEAWAVGDELTGYSSPALLEVGGKKQVIVYTGSAILGIQPDDGKQLWRHEYETEFGCNTATPIAVGDKVFCSSGENHGAVLLGLQASGTTFTTEPVWESQGASSVLRAEWQTPILLDGYLYGFDNVGSAGPVTHLTCIEAATGKRMWQKQRFGKGNLIAADGKLLITTMKGELILARASPKAYEELGRATILGQTRQAPALSDGRVYLRDDKEIVCVEMAK